MLLRESVWYGPSVTALMCRKFQRIDLKGPNGVFELLTDTREEDLKLYKTVVRLLLSTFPIVYSRNPFPNRCTQPEFLAKLSNRW